MTGAPSTAVARVEAHFRANLQRTGRLVVAFHPPLHLAWERTFDGEVRSPTIAHGRIYFNTLSGHVIALSLDGSPVWQFTSGTRLNASLMIWGNRAYCGCNDAYFYCLDAHTGELVWKYKAGAAIQGNFAAFGDAVFCGSYDGFVYAFDAATGDLRWKVHVGSGVNCSIAEMDGVLYFGTNGGAVYALDAHSGDILWQACAPGGINSTCAVSAHDLFIGTRTGQFCAFDLATGRLRWSLDFGSRIYASPAVDDAFVYIASDLGTLRKLRIEDGTLVWETMIGSGKLPPGGQVWTCPTLAGNVVWIGPALGEIMALDRATGAKRWSYPVEGPSSSSVAIGEDVLASSTGGNRLLVFRRAEE
ncbi:MAG: PQQ-binding-like beta-propeller repeat protein [Candidatus Brachytrichaceae bacterium NZ_4S206]|jgi:outer membrane protein assembly factor BamB